MKIVIVTLLLVAQSAIALDWTKSEQRDIYDIQYLPKSGTWFLSPSLNFLGHRNEKKINNVKQADTENKGTSIEFIAGYSFSDNLSLTLDLNYLIDSTTEHDDVMAGSFEESSRGPSDPRFQVKWRLLEQKDHYLNFDISPHYSLKTGDREIPSQKDEGNNKNGGPVYGVNLEAGLKFTKLQIKGLFNYSKFGEADLEPSGRVKEARNAYEMGGQVQFTLNEKWYFNLLMTYTNLDAHKEKGEDQFLQYPRTRSLKFRPEFIYLQHKDLAPFLRWELVQASRYKTTEEDDSVNEHARTGYSKISLGVRYQF